MEKSEKDLCETIEKLGKKGEAAEQEQEYTEALHSVIMMRKGKIEAKDEDVWFATVGNQLVSDGACKNKEELIESLEKLSLETVCKMIAGAFGRAIELSTNNEKQ